MFSPGNGRRLAVALVAGLILLGGVYVGIPKRDASGPCTAQGLAQATIAVPTPLPAWPVDVPTASPAPVWSPWFVTLYEGAQARIVLDFAGAAVREPVEKLLAEQPVTVVRQGVWRALWPQVRPCLEGRPIIRLGYSKAKRLEEPAVAQLSLGSKDGEVKAEASALWIAPSRRAGEPTWLVATAIGPADQRSLIYRQPNAGYTLDGPVTVMTMGSTEAARTFAADLTARLAAYQPSEARAKAQADAEAAVKAEDWRTAADAYERLLVATEREAKEPGPYGHLQPFFGKEYQVVELSQPEVLLAMARADLAAERTVYGAREALLHASYLAEEQGKRELMAEIRMTMREFMQKDNTWVEMQHRLAELEPDDARHWWNLAERRIIAQGFEPEPVVAVAERVGGADPARAASVYLKQAEAAVLVSELDFRPESEKGEPMRAARLVDEALRRQPDNSYGLFLKGARASRLGNSAEALKALAKAGDSAAVLHERAIARGAEVKPTLTLDLYAAPGAMTEADLKKAYGPMGYWNYSAKMPHPPAQQAVWAPSGEWLATTCTRFTGRGTEYTTDLCVVKVPEGEIHRIAGAVPVAMEWTPQGLLYSLGEGGLWFVAPGGTPRRLAPEAYDIAVAPDGDQVAFSGRDGLWRLELPGGKPAGIATVAWRVTTGAAPRKAWVEGAFPGVPVPFILPHSRPLWSPDGRDVFFAGAVTSAAPHMVNQIIYRVPADGSKPPAEVGRQNGVSHSWFNIAALRWWDGGATLLVRHSLYNGPEQVSQATLLPLDGELVTVGNRAPADLRERAETARQTLDRQRELVWVQDGARLVPVPMGKGEAPPAFDLGNGPGFAAPELGDALFAPGSTALAYTYRFGGGAHLFVQAGDRTLYLGPVEVNVLGAPVDQTDAVPLEWYRQRALPGWPISWSPDGRYVAWLKGDRLLLFGLK